MSLGSKVKVGSGRNLRGVEEGKQQKGRPPAGRQAGLTGVVETNFSGSE